MIISNCTAAGASANPLLQFRGCEIVSNTAGADASGVYCFAGTGSLTNSIVAFNEGAPGVGADQAGNAPSLTCCDVSENPADDYDATVGDQTGIDNNFSDDPEFCGLETADYRLHDTSPCLPGGRSPCGHVSTEVLRLLEHDDPAGAHRISLHDRPG